MHRNLTVFVVLLVGLAVCLSSYSAMAEAPRPTVLADGGQARLPIVVGPKASQDVKKSAADLARVLQQMTGSEFKIETSDGKRGIVLGTPADFEAVLPVATGFSGTAFDREHYVIKSQDDALFLLGATDLAVSHAVWDLLYRLGYRQFFPGETWEIVPALERIEVAIRADEKPDFLARRIWYNWGFWGYNNQTYRDWSTRNRAVQGFVLNSGHAYGNIYNAYRAEFEKHPEYLAMIDGERKYRGGDTKFCISNPGMRQLAVDFAKRQLERRPDLDSISMDPSDGGGWCQCEDCAKLGSVSNRVLLLANQVAEEINKLGLGDKYVGIYAYNEHSPPPTIQVHPKVIVTVTTSFLRGGLTFDQIVEGWQKQGATLGVYDYFTVVAWDWNLPRRSKAGNVPQLANAIVKYHQMGARFFDAESGDAWGPSGLGFYVASRLLWDVSEADRVEEIVSDFISRCFPNAQEPMRGFYTLLYEDRRLRSVDDILGRMYRYLDEALKQETDPKARERIFDLVKYTRYAELYNRFTNASGPAQANLKNEVLTWAYRVRKTSMVHAYGIWARMASQRAAAQADHPQKDETPVTEEDLMGFIAQGIENYQPMEMLFDTVEYSQDLIPAAEALGFAEVAPGSVPRQPQEFQNYWIWVEPGVKSVDLGVTVQKRWALRPHEVRLYSPKEVTIEPVAVDTSVEPDGKTYELSLATPHDELHRLVIRDGADFTRIRFPQGMPVTLESGMESPGVKQHFRGEWSLYFYVPKGTKLVAGWAGRIANWAPRVSGKVLDGDGHEVFDFGKMPGEGWFAIEVPEGQDGKLWKFEKVQGDRRLVTVPPYLARTGRELLLPREVVEKDKQK